MKVGLLHLSDLHISENSKIQNKLGLLLKALHAEEYDITQWVVVVTGDIAFSGKDKEYELAKDFFNKLRLGLKKTYFILVPGNHDCDFILNNQARDLLISCVDDGVLGSDQSIINMCVEPQNSFWKFRKQYNLTEGDKLIFDEIIDVGAHEISFRCFNTAWMSSLKEQPASIFFPIKRYQNLTQPHSTVSISILHHPLNWFTPEKGGNNKREMERYLTANSDFQMFGHEHEKGMSGFIDLDDNKESYIVYGDIFNKDDNPRKSGFQILKIDLNLLEGEMIKYSLKKDIYVENENRIVVRLNGNIVKEFTLLKTFSESLDNSHVPIFDHGTALKISEMFVYPDLDPVELNQEYINKYVDSKEILKQTNVNKWVLAGESQIGKSTLLKRLTQDFYYQGNYPILVTGDDLKEKNVNKFLRKHFKNTYKTDKETSFEHFKQYDSTKKILLIDDINNYPRSKTELHDILKQLENVFGKIVITIDVVGNVVTHLKSEYDRYKVFIIKPLGYKKRNDLIVNYQRKTAPIIANNEKEFLYEVRRKYEFVNGILGNKVVPSYPIFLISILQSIEAADLSNTSYGFCYQNLIYQALSNTAKLSEEQMGHFHNFLAHLAYHMHVQQTSSISEDEFISFYQEYKTKYDIQDYSYLKGKLLKSKIIVLEKTKFKFGWKYFLHFLAAKRISDILHKDEGKDVVNALFENLQNSQNANILVFLTHHTNDISFFQDSILHSMVRFEHIDPITLEKNDPFYTKLLKISEGISTEYLKKSDPNKARERELTLLDEKDREDENSGEKNVSQEIRDITKPYAQALASIDIMGQILRNRKGSLEIEKIRELIKESFLTGFRTIGSFGEMVDDLRGDIIDEIGSRVNNKDIKADIERKVDNFINILCVYSCVGIFKRIMSAVGTKGFNRHYNFAAENIGTPAATLLSFCINSYHNDLDVEEVKRLANEYNSNPAFMFILKERVKNHVYFNYIDTSDVHRLAQILKMKFNPAEYLRFSSRMDKD